MLRISIALFQSFQDLFYSFLLTPSAHCMLFHNNRSNQFLPNSVCNEEKREGRYVQKSIFYSVDAS